MFEGGQTKSFLRPCLEYKVFFLKTHCQCSCRTLSTRDLQHYNKLWQQTRQTGTAPRLCFNVFSGPFLWCFCVGEHRATAGSHSGKRSIVHIPATWDSSVSVMLHCLIDTFTEETGGKSPGHGHTMMEHGFKHTDTDTYICCSFFRF